LASYAPSRYDLLRRLRKIEGQVKGIRRMVEEDQYCVDVLVQIAAVRAAIHRVGTIIFEHHTRGCIREAMEQGKHEEAIEELIQVLRKFSSH